MPPVNLRACNGQYVCAEGGGGRELAANRSQALEWERFALVDTNAAKLNDGDQVLLQTYDGHYVCAEGGGGQELVANRPAAYEWETFTIQGLTRPGAEIQNGDRVALRTYDGHFVCAEGGGGRELVANRSQALEWETFTIEIPPRPPLQYDSGDVSIGPGKHMQTTVSFQPDGLMITVTRTENHVKFAGWHGGRLVTVCDASGNVLGSGPWAVYGVDGQWMPTGPSKRLDRAEDRLDPSLYDKAHHIAVLHTQVHKGFDFGRLVATGRKVQEVFDEIRRLVE